MDAEPLQRLGLTKAQAGVYLSLLQHPPSSAGEISKRLGLDRSFVYAVLESLTKKGLVTRTVKKEKTLFCASNPSVILERIKDDMRVAHQLVPELQMLRHPGYPPKVEIIEGKEALKRYFRELIAAKSFCTLGGGGTLNIFKVLRFEHKHYFKELKDANVAGKIICSHSNWRTWKENLGGTNVALKSMGGAGRDTSITILPDKVIFSSEYDIPSVVIIESVDHAHALRYYFDTLWKIARTSP